MQVGAVRVFGDLLVRKRKDLVDVIESFGVDVPVDVSIVAIPESVLERTRRDLLATPIVRSCLVLVAAAS